ncbi:hypothetical protein BOTBODRAFT_146042 [Botryobasidium botryosum FD-172 SS1]|uniref:DUF6699 domain-containing protein n=1 Tax=Botryobasidium botryosum (strain FD-172 SS1) TaxID=930990 RepID=A0A067MPX7_BOTB1|nr:hypothetical protein BOTBODRAFT_146042 [Botryobasidium botryosum FD-172 SS1]
MQPLSTTLEVYAQPTYQFSAVDPQRAQKTSRRRKDMSGRALQRTEVDFTFGNHVRPHTPSLHPKGDKCPMYGDVCPYGRMFQITSNVPRDAPGLYFDPYDHEAVNEWNAWEPPPPLAHDRNAQWAHSEADPTRPRVEGWSQANEPNPWAPTPRESIFYDPREKRRARANGGQGGSADRRPSQSSHDQGSRSSSSPKGRMPHNDFPGVKPPRWARESWVEPQEPYLNPFALQPNLNAMSCPKPPRYLPEGELDIWRATVKLRKPAAQLNPVLKAGRNILFFDLRFRNYDGLTPDELNQPATWPPSQNLRIITLDSPFFDWVVEVKSREDAVVTCRDVFESIHSDLNKLLLKSEYTHTNDEEKKVIYDACHDACYRKREPRPKDAPSRRVDFFGMKTMFQGLYHHEPTLNVRGISDTVRDITWAMELSNRRE